jgi:putative tricarboxylic transport membrane protein
MINPIEAIPLVLSLKFMPYIVLGSIVGMFVGAMPGLTSMSALIVALPVSFYMDTDVAMAMLVSIYMSSCVGGGLTAVYFNIPGTPQAALTTLDGNPMAKKGLDNEAVGIVIGASFMGGLISYLILALAIGPLGEIAIKFGPIELFFTALLGMVCAAGVKSKFPLKGLSAGFLGFLLGTIGLGPMGNWRATFGMLDLMEGIPFLPVLIGQLAMSEVFILIEKETVLPTIHAQKHNFAKFFRGLRYPLTKPIGMMMGSIIGTVVGIIPGEGATMASFLAYSRAKESSKHKELFGTGVPEGVMASETANNASTGGGLLTSLLLGIPGTGSCALLLAALMLHGIQAGPMMFIKHTDVISRLLTSLFISNFVMLFIGWASAYSVATLVKTPTKVLIPIITVFCMLGAYVDRNSMFDIWLMFVFGLLGWLMRKYEYPTIALVVGLIVAPIADNELIRAFQIFHERIFGAIWASPIALILIGINLVLLYFMFRTWKWKVD